MKEGNMENIDWLDEPEMSRLRALCAHRVELRWGGAVYCAQCGLFVRSE